MGTVDDGAPQGEGQDTVEGQDQVQQDDQALQDTAAAFVEAGGPTLEEKSADEPVDDSPKICPTVTLQANFREPSGKEKDVQIPINLMTATFTEFNQKSEKYPNFEIDKSAKARRWAATIGASIQHLQIDDMLVKSTTREGSDWQQNVESGGQRISISRPTFASTSEAGNKLMGEQALVKMQTAMNLGSMIQVPLWHSGVWVSIKAPTDAQLLILERAQADEKIMLGRQTQGLIYSHSNVYMINYLMGLIVDQLHNTNVKDHKDEKLLEVVKITDLPTLVWGLACTIYPNGYTFHNPCIDNPHKCQHIVEEKLILSKLFFFDRSGITPEQGMYMADRTKIRTVEEVQSYQKKGRGADGRVIELNDDIKMVLKVPTIREYIDSGFKWIEGIVQTIDKTMTGTLNLNDKNKYINQHSMVSIYRQYAHWVERIVFRDNDIIEDRETIEELLTMLSSDVEISRKFFDGVKAYIDDVTIALIAIPSYNCPNCKRPMTPEEAKHPFLITLDVISTFFTLAHRRLDRIRQPEIE